MRLRRTMEKADFFTTAAQVIPVAIIALFVEQRVFEPRDHPRQSDRLDALGVLVLLLAAEWTALFALFEQKSSDFSQSVVLLGLVIGFFWLVLSPLRRLLREAAPKLYLAFYIASTVALGVVAFALPGVDGVAAVGFTLFVVAFLASAWVSAREGPNQTTDGDSTEASDG